MDGNGGFLNPQKVVSELDIKAPLRIADFGCGHGYFAIPLAKAVGKEGHIFAIDILSEALDEVKERALAEGLGNIETFRGNLEVPGGSKVPDNSCDMVVLANILYQSTKKPQIIKEAHRVLRFGGKLVIIDWERVGSHLTADSGWRISEDEAKIMAQDQNFSFDRKFNADNYHYGMIFSKF